MREFLLGHLAGAVDAVAELGDALLVDVEAEHGKMPGEIDRERQADIAEADHANSYIGLRAGNGILAFAVNGGWGGAQTSRTGRQC